MKNFLLALSGMSALSLGSSVNAVWFLNNKNINRLNINTVTDNQEKLFSNSYQALGNSTNIITNQSTIDHQYYSYDLSPLPDKLSNEYNPKKLFIVDDQGALQYTSDASNHIPPGEKAMVDNVKTEIEQNKKVTTIKNSYNPISRSEYNSDYFTGYNNSWQYLQFGGIEKHIDISHESNVNDNIENSGHLSESLGLYYIAKAARALKIDQSVAISIANTFVKKSSLASSLGTNSDLVMKIMELLDYNDNLYNFVLKMPFWNDDKNYSLNFIFDQNNNLIEIYFNKWNKDSLNFNLNYKYSNDYSGFESSNDYKSKTYILFNWTHYAKTWDEFYSHYDVLSLDSSSYISVTTQGQTTKNSDFKMNIDSITNTVGQSNFDVHQSTSSGLASSGIKVLVNFWHDDHNFYYYIDIEEYSNLSFSNVYVDINLNDLNLHNKMN